MTRDTDHIEVTDHQMNGIEAAVNSANVETIPSGIKDLSFQTLMMRLRNRESPLLARHEALKALEALEYDIACTEAHDNEYPEYVARARGARRRIGRALDNLESRELEGV